MKAFLGDSMTRFCNRAGGEALVLVVLGGIIWAVGVEQQAFEGLVALVMR